MSRYYKTNQILMFVGSKVNFEDGIDYYTQLDEIINQFNAANADIHLMYSTLTFYDETVQAHNYILPVNYFDMLPLTDDDQRYFTGLYTSRPNLKAFLRRASQDLHASSKIFAMKVINP